MKRLLHLIVGVAIGALMTTLTFAISSRAANIQDPVRQSPQFYKVLLQNDEVRVLEYRLKPGEKEPMHSHGNGIIYTLGGAKMKTTFPDGRTEESPLSSGEVRWRNPVTHAMENTGKTDAHAIAVELKNPCNQK